MSFERKPMEKIVSKMISWTQGVSKHLTDFRVGSNTRTIYEAVAVVVEEQYDKIYRTLKELIEENIYAIFGFSKLPPTHATGVARFSRSLPATQHYFIPKGTTLSSQSTAYSAPLKFQTSEDGIIAIGTTYADVLVVCEELGTQGNIPANYLTTFVQKPTGVDAVSNPLEFVTGRDEENKENQKSRFQEFIISQARGVLQAIEYGAKLAKLYEPTTGLVVEEVQEASAFEYLPERKGEIDLYIWNGVGIASEDLKAEVAKVLTGYYDDEGKPVYGYKAGGILVNIYTSPIKYVTIKMVLTTEMWAIEDDVILRVEDEVQRYFSTLRLGQEAIQASLQANIKYAEGVKDIKLYFSLDSGSTYSMDNITADNVEKILPIKPYVYE